MGHGKNHHNEEQKPLPEEDSDLELNNNQEVAEEATEDSIKSTERQPIQVAISDIELEQLKSDAAEHKDKYLRLLAESENTRKRLNKEKQELTQYAVQNVIVDFLNPIDHMENALKYTDQLSDELKHWAVGFKMILEQFKEVLSNNGVVTFVSKGTHFDPHSHEAIETIETTEHPAGIVLEENIKGYKMGDRIIRPARVKVSKTSAQES